MSIPLECSARGRAVRLPTSRSTGQTFRQDMNLDIDQHETFISAPDDSAKVVREAIPPAPPIKVVIPGPIDQQVDHFPGGRKGERRWANWYGTPLVWRGLHLLGVSIGIAAVWFVAAWVRHGRLPLGMSFSNVRLSIGGPPPSPILPSTWLVAVLGLLALISLCMMFVGTQDANPKMMFKKDRSPNNVSATPKPGAPQD